VDRCRRLLERAQDNPSGLRFRELRDLAGCYGFHLVRQKGSHHIFKRVGYRRLLNFQDSTGMAKGYQVRQLLSALEELGVLPGESS
jgi:hypothetical protein